MCVKICGTEEGGEVGTYFLSWALYSEFTGFFFLFLEKLGLLRNGECQGEGMVFSRVSCTAGLLSELVASLTGTFNGRECYS